VDSIFGSLATIVGEGGVAVLYFSYRLIQFPLGIFSNALAQAILPAFSHQALDDSRERLKLTLAFGLRAVFFLMLPASVAFIALAHPIVSTLFGGGRFDAYSCGLTADALIFYSIGLCAYAGTKILQSCFFSLKDTMTPTKISALALGVNIVLNSILMFPLKIGGIALATSISGVNTFFILFFILKRRLGDFQVKEIAASFLRVLAASLCMGIVCYLFSLRFSALGAGSAGKFINLGLLVACGLFSYTVFCFIFGVSEMRELWRWVLKRGQVKNFG
jgi:putative peptidoglycan lipid II flippase